MIFTQQLLGFGGASLWPEAIERHHWRLHAAHVTAGQARWYLSLIITHRCHVLVNLSPLTMTPARQRTVLLAMVLWVGPKYDGSSGCGCPSSVTLRLPSFILAGTRDALARRARISFSSAASTACRVCSPSPTGPPRMMRPSAASPSINGPRS